MLSSMLLKKSFQMYLLAVPWQTGSLAKVRRMRYSPGILLRPIPTRQNEIFVVLKAEQVTRFETTTKVEKKLDRFVTGVFYKS